MARKVLFLGAQRDFMQEFLDQPEGTEPSADKPSQKYPEQHQRTKNITGKTEGAASQYCLQGANGTGTNGTGTGIAV